MTRDVQFKIPYGRQSVSKDDIDTVVDTLTSDWLTQGPAVDKFEDAVANYCGAAFGVAVSNATAALHLACLSLGVGPNDTVWTSPNTFVASANCALYCGAAVDFVDIDSNSLNMSVSALRTKLMAASVNGKLPKCVIPVHFAGQSCDMESIKDLSEQYGFHIIEDASHAIGGTYKGTQIGSCRYSDITVFSFHPVKIITTGEGGMVMTNQKVIRDKVMTLRSHGITRNATEMEQGSSGPWDYQQLQLGYNYRLTDIQAALGLSQLQRITEFVNTRIKIVETYRHAFANASIQVQSKSHDSVSANHLFIIRLSGEDIKNRLSIFNRLRDLGIGVNVHYKPVHMQPFYQRLGFGVGDFPEAERYYSEAITLPLHPRLSDAEIAHIVNSVKSCVTG